MPQAKSNQDSVRWYNTHAYVTCTELATYFRFIILININCTQMYTFLINIGCCSEHYKYGEKQYGDKYGHSNNKSIQIIVIAIFKVTAYLNFSKQYHRQHW